MRRSKIKIAPGVCFIGSSFYFWNFLGVYPWHPYYIVHHNDNGVDHD